jgi:CubicO group peptidase (beta-lactamase class C family)
MDWRSSSRLHHHLRVFRAALLLLLAVLGPQSSVLGATYWPGKTWERIVDPTTAGYSRAGLQHVVDVTRGYKTSAMMVVVGGRVLLDYGDTAEVSYLASARKSVLSMLYGRYVENGTIKLDETLADLGFTDVGGLLDIEKRATVENLISARSGVYHRASNPGDLLELAPPRGSQKPGTYWLYSNWDFNAAGDVFEMETGRNIFDALETDLARPIGMQDFDRKIHEKSGDRDRSIHPAYHMHLSTRDMARLGLVMLREGRWRDQQVVPKMWVRLSTRIVTPHSELKPPPWNDTGLAYGYMWWIEQRKPDDPLDRAFSAQGAFGQYIMVIPKLDMVIAHKVVICDETAPDVWVDYTIFSKIVDAVVAARCNGTCN